MTVITKMISLEHESTKPMVAALETAIVQMKRSYRPNSNTKASKSVLTGWAEPPNAGSCHLRRGPFQRTPSGLLFPPILPLVPGWADCLGSGGDSCRQAPEQSES